MNKPKLLIASNNQGKIREIKALLTDVLLDVVSLQDFGMAGKQALLKETGETFAQNAVLKAEAYGKATGLLSLADDSGLMIDALGGKPGVRSARFVRGADEDRWKKVLRLMRGIPSALRTARFVSAVAVYDPKTKTTVVFTGETRGEITLSAGGSGGFGYDPIFYSKELQKTFGEAQLEEKNRVSHRARALRKAKTYLKKFTTSQ
mgnify:CR=1 FL=1